MVKDVGLEKLMAQRDQEEEGAIEFIRGQLASGSMSMAELSHLCLTITSGTDAQMRQLGGRELALAQRFAWLGLTRVLELYAERREGEKWA